MALSFKGRLFLMGLMISIPAILEATIVALISTRVFEFPIAIGYCLGFCLSTLSPALIVPSMIQFNLHGYGRKKGIPILTISASTFDILLVFINFNICHAIALSQEEIKVSGRASNPGISVGIVLAEYFGGAAAGLLISVTSLPFRYLTNRYQLMIKAAYQCVFGIGIIVTCQLTYSNAWITAIIFFGYGCSLFWGKNVPTKEMAAVWFFAQPILFGPSGAGLVIANIKQSDVGYAFLLIICGVTLRVVGIFLATIGQGFTIKEKFIIVFSNFFIGRFCVNYLFFIFGKKFRP